MNQFNNYATTNKKDMVSVYQNLVRDCKLTQQETPPNKPTKKINHLSKVNHPKPQFSDGATTTTPKL